MLMLKIILIPLILLSMSVIVNSRHSEDLGILALDFVEQLIIGSLNRTETLDPECNRTMYQSINDPHKRFLIKLVKDSAKNKNDLGSYLDCFTINYLTKNGSSTIDIKDNLTYVIIHINKEEYNVSDIRYETSKFIFGACVPLGCSLKDMTTIFSAINNVTELFLQLGEKDIHVYQMDNKGVTFTWGVFCSLIPVYLLGMFMIFSCFPSIPAFICKCYFKKAITTDSLNAIQTIPKEDLALPNDDPDKSNLSENFIPQDDKIPSKKIEKKMIVDITKKSRFKSCFSINENAEEIMSSNIFMHGMNICNDSGLSIIKGLRGVTMILVIIGLTFQHLYMSPVKIVSNVTFRNLITNFAFSLILFGERFGIRIFYSISGFCLIYKMLCYLDNEIEKLDTGGDMGETSKLIKKDKDLTEKKENANANTNTYTISGILENLPLIKRPENENASILEELEEKKDPAVMQPSRPRTLISPMSFNNYSEFSEKLSRTVLARFISFQIYKYFLFVLLVFFFKFSYFKFIQLLYVSGPVWTYLNKVIIENFTFKHILTTILLLAPYSHYTYYQYDPFLIVQNEMTFFLSGSVLIFFFYKNNWRLDCFIFLTMFLILCGKLGIFFLTYNLYEENDRFYPSISFQENFNSFILKNPLYNSPSFLIGLFFGMVNYCIQKSISIDNYEEEMKSFLYYPCVFLSIFKKHQISKILFISIVSSIIFFGVMFGFTIIYSCFFFKNNDESMSDFFASVYVNLYFLYDVELGTILLFLILIPLFLIGDNFIISFLRHDYWSFLARPYYVFIMTINLIIYYIFYQSESRVKLEFFNIIFFSLLMLMMTLIICAMSYIFYEVPLKKLNKLLVKDSWTVHGKSSASLPSINLSSNNKQN